MKTPLLEAKTLIPIVSNCETSRTGCIICCMKSWMMRSAQMTWKCLGFTAWIGWRVWSVPL